MFTAIIPIAGFILSYYLNNKNLHGEGLLIVVALSWCHVSLVVSAYDAQFLEVLYLFIAFVPLFPFDNLKLIKLSYLLSYLAFIFVGFHLKKYNLFEIIQWPVSVRIYFVLMNLVFIILFQFLLAYKKRILEFRSSIINKNKEIQEQNELIKLNTKMIIKFKNEKHDLELTNKQKDVEILHINNQQKIKMKNSLIKDLMKLKKNKADYETGIQLIISKLKHQADEESKLNLLQNNLDIVGADFNLRIKQKFPILSKTDIELLSLLKLKLNNKQIAIQRNTSPNTINVAFHRLKQKCNFDSTNDLKRFIEEF